MNETFDLVTLDMHPAEEVIADVMNVMNPGGFCVVFSPFIEQAKDVRSAIRETGFEEVVTYEISKREISFGPKGTRPSTIRVGHTGYITFARES